MQNTVEIFHELNKKYSIGIHNGMVFGEFGAERAQRVLALIDEYGLEKAYAFDISPDMLEISRIISEARYKAEYQGRQLPHEKLVLVAGDFMKAKENIDPQQLDFVFCFATIHHFPDPRPVFQVAHSLLKDGGYFYFDREALRSWLGLHEVARLGMYLRHGKVVERDYGILETQFSLEIWREAFDTFQDWDIHLKYPMPVLENIYNFSVEKVARSALLRFTSQTFGGRLYGILRKGKKLHL